MQMPCGFEADFPNAPASGRRRRAFRAAAIAQRLGQMRPAHAIGAVEIGERARELEHAMIAARGKAHAFGGVAQQRRSGASGAAIVSTRLAGAAALQPTWSRPSSR